MFRIGTKWCFDMPAFLEKDSFCCFLFDRNRLFVFVAFSRIRISIIIDVSYIFLFHPHAGCLDDTITVVETSSTLPL